MRMLQFVFSSDEYPEYTNSIYNDMVGVWINGTHVPLSVANSGTAINSVNDQNNVNLYNDNTSDQFNTEMDGFTGEQRVFIGYGQVWATKYRDEALRNQVQTDPHSPAQFRANGAVRNVPEFYNAFDVTKEDALYLPPEKRVKIW